MASVASAASSASLESVGENYHHQPLLMLWNIPDLNMTRFNYATLFHSFLKFTLYTRPVTVHALFTYCLQYSQGLYLACV